MGTLKENIQHEVHLFKAKSLDHDFNMERNIETKNTATRRVISNNYREQL
jgi:hypothetical protein